MINHTRLLSLAILIFIQNAVSNLAIAEEKASQIDLGLSYIKAVVNQQDPEKLKYWLQTLDENGWQQGYEKSDFSRAKLSSDIEELLASLSSKVKHQSNSSLALTIKVPNLIPESIAFDGNRLFIGSLKHNAVYVID